MNSITKKCKKCGNIKLLKEDCPFCKKIRDAKYREANKQKIKSYHSVYRKEHSEKLKLYQYEYSKKNQNLKEDRRKAHLKNKYNITLEDYRKMFEQQNGVCAICGGNNNGKTLHVDHRHDLSMEVRGLLCNSCNVSLGGFRDNVTILQKAINYLQKK